MLKTVKKKKEGFFFETYILFPEENPLSDMNMTILYNILLIF